MRIYRIVSPYFFIKEGSRDLDQSAAYAGMIKSSYEELRELLISMERLTSVTAPQEETRCRELLELLIDAKRSYAAAEAQRAAHAIHEAKR